MAYRKHVSVQLLRTLIALSIFATLGSACSRAGPPATESRGRVIDQETGLPIARAIVVGKYMGSIAWAGASCDRIESADADDQGWFSIPTDSNGKPPFMEAYSQGYGRGKSPRHAFNGAQGDNGKWQVEIEQWDADNRRATLLSIEPAVYHSQRDAEEASREWKDVYLKRVAGGQDEHLMELRRLVNGGICGGGPQSSTGPIEFLEAIRSEQIALGETESQLARTRDVIESAARASTRAQERLKAQSK